MQNDEIELSEESPEKRRTLLAILCIFVGYFGVHRFMTGKWKSGLFQLFTLGGFYIWWLVDIVMLITGSFTDTDGIPFREKIEEYKDEHPEIYDGYESVGFGKWFLLVELPWILLIASPFCPAIFEKQLEEFVSDSIYVYVCLAVPLFAILFIIITIGFKNKIRTAKGIVATMNPYTWFTSYVGKAFLGTLFFTLGIGVYICVAIFFSSAKVGADSFVSNEKRGEGSKAANSSARKISNAPTNSSERKNSNAPINSSERRNSSAPTNYYCEYCGSKYPSISSLTNGSCARHPNGNNKGRHKPYEGDEKSQYACKYCGTKYPSISSMANGLCARHPDGHNKGRHVPMR